MEFLKNNEDIDVFCLQEVYHDAKGKEVIYTDAQLDIYEDISKVLVDYNRFYRPHLKDYYGLAIFVKKGIEVLEEGEHYVHKHEGYTPTKHVGFHAKNVQYINLFFEDKEINIINFHGLWNGNGKTDTEDRINQSKNIKNFVKTLSGEVIICGDFNLRPDTESLKILEVGMKNLITDYGITSTRTSLYTKPEKYADYVLVSNNIEVKDFRVLPEEVSDHSALLLEI